MGNQRLIQTQTAATDQKQHLDKRTQQPESSLEEVLSSRAASRQFRAQLQRHQAEGTSGPNPLHSILQMISSVSPRAIQAKPKFRGLSHELTPALDSEGMVIQAKMTIGAPGDQYEQEADRVAEQVVQKMHAPSTPESTLGGSIQRQRREEDGHALRMKPSTQHSPMGGMAATQDLESSVNRARGSGQPLEAGLQRKLGQAMGADFSGVRVHTGNQADQLNRSIQAKAFTTGQDMFFRQGAYQPGSREGQELLAHELTHVIQQQGPGIQPEQQTSTARNSSTMHTPRNMIARQFNGQSVFIQRMGSYIPGAGDGPYAANFSDGPSTAGAQFTPQLKNDIYEFNEMRADPENHDLIYIDDEDDQTMLTRDSMVVAEVDHIYPVSLGGSSSHRNAQIISKDSNSYKTNVYPTHGLWSGGCEVIMGHAAHAQGVFRGANMSFNVPAYERFPVTGSGPGATIDMSQTNLTVHYLNQYGQIIQTIQGPGAQNVTPAEARALGILPGNMPNPRQ
jgi:Domain of unknown function (DUF4157)/HNH endonuclease